jgi:hypothetical protein
MADVHVPGQLPQMARVEDIANQAPGFPRVKFAVAAGGYSGGILAAVLPDQQGIADVMAGTCFRNHADNPAHDFPSETPLMIVR